MPRPKSKAQWRFFGAMSSKGKKWARKGLHKAKGSYKRLPARKRKRK